MQIKELNKLATKLSEKLDKSKINIIIDIIKCKNKYKISLEEYEFYEFYNLTDEEKSTYLTKEKNNELIDLYNKESDRILLEDRGLLYKEFNKYIKRDYIDLRDVTFKEFTNFIMDKDRVICKKINESTYEVLEIDKDKLKNEYNILKTYNNIMKQEEYIVEELIHQNKVLSKIYSECLNTIKITTINDKVINKIFIIGNKTNQIKKGALYAFIDDEGKINYAQDLKGHYFKEHPLTYERIEDFKIPYFNKMISLAKSLAKELKTLKYITWEFGVTEEDIVLINASIPYEILQSKPSINKTKRGLLEKIEREGEIYER